MATPLTRAGVALNIRLAESPNLSNPVLNNEFQEIHNAVRILASYLEALRGGLESQPGQPPNESVRFRRSFWATALQDITVGSVCSSFENGIINGVKSSEPFPEMVDGVVSLGSTGTRTLFGVRPEHFYIALSEAKAGELVECGVGPGVLAVTGAICGRRVWGIDSRSIYTARRANTAAQILQSRDIVGNGGIYLDNIIGVHIYNENPFSIVDQWEGYWMPGFPDHQGNTYQYNRVFAYPIGVCISDGFVLFSDYKRADPLRRSMYYPEYVKQVERGPQ